MPRTKHYSNVVTIDEVVKVFGLPTADSVDDQVIENMDTGVRRSEFESDEDFEKALQDAEDEIRKDAYHQWSGAVSHAVNVIANEAKLDFDFDFQKGTVIIEPLRSGDWESAGRFLWQTIGGVGLTATGSPFREEMAQESVSTPRQYVLKHWKALWAVPEVWGGSKAETLFWNHMR